MILTVSSFAFCFVKNDLLTIRAVLCRKRAQMPVCMVLVELAITCIHDYKVVTITVTKICGKMNFNGWVLAITAVPTTLISRFPTTGYARVL